MARFSLRMVLGCVMAVGVMGITVRWGTAENPPAAGDGYPSYVKKELYAKDLRGQKAPELVVEKWLTAQPDTKGKVVLIDFWATWCPPCRKSIPELNALQKEFKDDLVVIGVSKEEPGVVTKFNADAPDKLEYANGTDSKGTTSNAYEVKGIPHVTIISTDGIVRWQGFPLSDDEPLTADIVKKIINNDPGVAERHKKEAATRPAGTQGAGGG